MEASQSRNLSRPKVALPRTTSDLTLWLFHLPRVLDTAAKDCPRNLRGQKNKERHRLPGFTWFHYLDGPWS